MITEDLIEYIKSQLSNNVSKYLIISQLIEVGWHIEDIEEGFSTIESAEANKKLDKPFEFEEIKEVEKVIEPIKQVESKKIWTPTTIEAKVEEIIAQREVKNNETSNNTSATKSSQIELYNLELPQEQKPQVNASPIIEEVIKTEIPKVETSPLELMPTINKSLLEESQLQQNSQAILNSYIQKPSLPKSDIHDIVPKTAMIASYSQDILASTEKEENLKPALGKKTIIKWIIIIFIFIFLGGMVFAFVNGYVKIPGFGKSFSVVKKDPRNIILNTPSSVSKLKSYKVENKISISSPSLSNITTGLASGEAVTSGDRESISISAIGSANNQDGKLIFDYLVKLKSSIQNYDITSNWKYDGSSLYVEIPDLSTILGNDAPSPALVKLDPSKLGDMISNFSPNIEDIIKKVDIYNMMSEGVPLYVKTEASSIIKEFIDSTTYGDKGKEIIHGVSTYHYELTADRLATKKLLSSLADLLIMKVSSEQKQILDEAIGASSVSSFDVWVGENDDNLYQIKFNLNMPLSKVLNLNDSGIADNEVKLEWTTTYFDLDVENKIDMPSDAIDITTFINRARDIKIKNVISSFRSQATAFKNATGSYGLRSNPTGNCTNPNPSSLFSPQGHKKSADTAISTIATSMNSLLLSTGGLGSCYSTSSAWAISAPIFDNTDPLTQSYYCNDGNGKLVTITTPIKGPSCK